VLQPDNRRHTVIDVELPHVILPMDMGVEQSGDDEFPAEIDHLCTWRGYSALGQQFANDIALDQEGAALQRSVREAVHDRGARDEKRLWGLRPAARPCSKGEKCCNENVGTTAHALPPQTLLPHCFLRLSTQRSETDEASISLRADPAA